MKQVAVLPIAVIIAVFLSACGGYKTHITPSQQLTLASANPLNEPTRTLVIEDVQITRNGQAQNIDPGLVQRFAYEMRRSGLFQMVYDPLNTRDEPKDAVRMKLYVTEMLDRHWGEKVGKDILVGLTYFTLAPLMPYQIQYDVSLRVIVTLRNGGTREFESSTKAEADYKVFSDRQAAEEDLKQTAMNDCLNGLLAKIKSNEEFLLALALSEHQPNTHLTLQEKPLEDRLRELKGLRARGLISPEEYYEKRAKLLEEF